MGLFGKKDKKVKIALKTNENIGNIGKGNYVDVISQDDERKLEIKLQFEKKGTPHVFISYDKITRVECLAETEIIEYKKNKSVVGRAIGGGLLLGPLGATIGAISGVGSTDKQKKEYTFYIVINYISSSDEAGIITFTVPNTTLSTDKFVKHMKSVCNINDEVIQEEINL